MVIFTALSNFVIVSCQINLSYISRFLRYSRIQILLFEPWYFSAIITVAVTPLASVSRCTWPIWFWSNSTTVLIKLEVSLNIRTILDPIIIVEFLLRVSNIEIKLASVLDHLALQIRKFVLGAILLLHLKLLRIIRDEIIFKILKFEHLNNL